MNERGGKKNEKEGGGKKRKNKNHYLQGLFLTAPPHS